MWDNFYDIYGILTGLKVLCFSCYDDHDKSSPPPTMKELRENLE